MASAFKRVAQHPSLILVLGFIALGSYLVRTSEAASALTWMHVFDPADFVDASSSEILGFFRELMIPIPPVVGLAEIMSIKLVGSPILITRYAYRLALVGSYAVAIWLAGTSRKRSVAAFLVGTLFLYVTTKVHPGDPHSYDIFFPFSYLLFILSLRHSIHASRPGLMALLAGFFLSMSELTRPFMAYLMPLLAVGAYFFFVTRGLHGRQFAAFVLPIILISGGWHAYLLGAHGQLTISNHTGYNVARAWPQIPPVQLIDEPHYAPLAPGRWANLNTEEHGENSRRAQLSQLRYWITHPVGSALFAASRLADFLRADTAFDGFVPESRWFGVYALAVRLISSVFFVSAGFVVVDACMRPRNLRYLLAHTDNFTILFTVACAAMLASGEIREEPRLLLSILPMFAILPLARPAQPGARDAAMIHVSGSW